MSAPHPRLLISVPLKERDLATRTRKKLAEFVFAGEWGKASTIVK